MSIPTVFDLGTNNPDEIIQRVAVNMIHPRVDWDKFYDAFPFFRDNKYDLALMPDPEEIIDEWIQHGKGQWGYERPPELYGFVEPVLLAPHQRVPHECMGIAGVTEIVLQENEIDAHARVVKTHIDDGKPLIGHWIVEYKKGNEWVARDPSFPARGCQAHPEHYLTSEIYSLIEEHDHVLYSWKEAQQALQNGLSKKEAFDCIKGNTMKNMLRDAWTVANGALMIGKNKLIFYGNDGAIDIKDLSPSDQARMYDAYSKEFNAALGSRNREHINYLANRMVLVPK
ncbi:MAG: hypothetical protein HY832_01975 [Candidatus Aenigmarchaeota archaeon]|nr:hypothetical protein [Candidatus Aenigmarchaeota archaeon]